MRIRLLAPVTAAVVAAVLPALPAAADPTNTATVTSATAKSVRVTPDRVWWVDTNNVLHVEDADTGTSPTTLGSPYGYTATVGTYGTSATPVYSTSGNQVAYLDASGGVIHLLDVSTGASRTTPSVTGLTTIKLSGTRLELDTPTAVYVRDLGTGAQSTYPPSATLSGRYVAYFNNDGSIVRKDLMSGVVVQVRPAGPPANCSTCTVKSPVAVKMRGDWVYWKFSCELRGVNLATHAAAIDLTSSCLKKFSLLDGYLAYKDSAGVVQAQDLKATSPSPIALTSAPVDGYSVEDRALGWYDANGVHVGAVQLPGYNPSTRLADAVTPPAFSPNGDQVKDVWTPTFTASSDFAWAVSISRSGTPVQTLTGAARYGVLSPVWAPGADVPDGLYSWVLSARDGTPVRGTDGAGGGMSGTVVVRRTGMGGSVSAPLVSSTTKTGLTLPVQLAAAVPGGLPGYGVASYTVQVVDNGVLRTLRTTSTAPVLAALQGHTYRVRVQVVDDAGNTGPMSAYATTAVPFDDRSTALRYSTGWTATTGSGAFLGTLHVSRAPGRSVSLRAPMRRFAVVVTACSTCGKVKVLVDGHYVTTVDTYASRVTVRKVVLVRSISSTAGLHTVGLVVIGTPGRPYVRLDAIAGIR